MRKGIVMEQSKKFTIVMTSEGSFLKAKRLKNAEIGMEVYFQAYEPGSMIGKFMLIHRLKIATAVLALLLSMFPTYLWHEGNKAYALVNMDINPSVEMKVNEKMKVIDIQALNEDAEEMIASLEDWKKSSVSKVALQMIKFSRAEGLLNSEHQVLIGVSYLEGTSDLDFSDQIESYLDERMQDILLASYTVPDTVRVQAEEEGFSVNEIMARKIENEGDLDNNQSDQPSVSLEEDDKEIIQSFYNENDSTKDTEEQDEEEVEIPADTSRLEEPTAVPIPSPPKTASKEGKEAKPSQKKKHPNNSDKKEKATKPPSHADSQPKDNPEKKDKQKSAENKQKKAPKEKSHKEKKEKPKGKENPKGKKEDSKGKKENRGNESSQRKGKKDKEKNPSSKNAKSSHGKSNKQEKHPNKP
ncbi:anti-sigma factor domain-containing protein [Halobacillus massiliensis]|uniref:anti-sigma factor domain-containing protein n=1 Tax=Halobacillus massiliensis TaxID=1926286 RepID=UPI0009E4BBD9|nr:anti-sigma factor domain-containing protein [Halobacillus massiliensis]